MEKIRIRNFGPVHDVEIDLEKNFQIFIGTQASGKSTICKAIYFCKKIGDYTSEYLKEGIKFTTYIIIVPLIPDLKLLHMFRCTS